MTSATNVVDVLGHFQKQATFQAADLEEITIKRNPMTLVLIGSTGAMTAGSGRETVGAHSVYAYGTTNALTLPAGYMVYRVDIRVVTEPAGGGGAQLSLGTNATGQSAAFCAADDVPAYPASDMLYCGDVTTPYVVGTTADETATYNVSGAALTAGSLILFYNILAVV